MSGGEEGRAWALYLRSLGRLLRRLRIHWLRRRGVGPKCLQRLQPLQQPPAALPALLALLALLALPALTGASP